MSIFKSIYLHSLLVGNIVVTMNR